MRNREGNNITSVTLKFEMHLRPLDGSEGPKEPILIPYTKLSLFDLDEANGAKGREVSRPPWRPPRACGRQVVTHHLAVRRSFGVLQLCALRT